MIKKEGKEKSRRKKNSYEEIKVSKGSSFMIKQYFLKEYPYYWKQQNVSGISYYREFKSDPLYFASSKTKCFGEYIPVPMRYDKSARADIDKEIELKVKYFDRKIVYEKKERFARDLIENYKVSDALLVSLCL